MSSNGVSTQADDFKKKLEKTEKKSIYTMLEEAISRGVKQLPQPMKVPLAKISADDNIRTFSVDTPDFEAFALSIKNDGLLSPVLLWYDRFAQNFVVIAGHRRVAAFDKNGEVSIPAFINLAETKSTKLSLLENVLRKDVSPIEYCEGLAAVKAESKYSQGDLAKVLGVSKSKVSSCLGISEWDETRKKRLHTSKIPLSKLIEIHNQRAKVDIGVALKKAYKVYDTKKSAEEKTPGAAKVAVAIPAVLQARMDSYFEKNPSVKGAARTKFKGVVRSYSSLSNPEKSKMKEFLSVLFSEHFDVSN